MSIVIVALVARCVATSLLNSSEPRNGRLLNDDGFEAKLKQGYDLLKNIPNSDDTAKFLLQLHNMTSEIMVELTPSPEQNVDLLNVMKNYGPIKKDLIQPMGDTIEEINRNSKVATALFQGDMLLTKAQAEEIMNDITRNERDRNKRQAFRDHTYPRSLWSNGVYYSFFPTAPNEVRKVFRKAASLWSLDTCINFGESNSAADRINVIQGSGCFSNVGRIGGVQSLSLGSGCESVGTAAHEIGHALGLFHTQTRHDRDRFITIYTQNIMPGWSAQFTKESERTNYNYNLTYDYGSVMHYGATSVSKNGQPVMIPRDVKYMQTLGSRTISFYEKLMINMHYKCLDICTTSSSASCENGGFPHPRDCSKCICPSGYGGRLCNKRPNGCGKTLTASTSFQELEDRVSGSGNTTNDEFTACNYWIQAPAGSTIEVVLDRFTTTLGAAGCPYAGVEIKTGKDKRHTGYRFFYAASCYKDFCSIGDFYDNVSLKQWAKASVNTAFYNTKPDF